MDTHFFSKIILFNENRKTEVKSSENFICLREFPNDFLVRKKKQKFI